MVILSKVNLLKLIAFSFKASEGSNGDHTCRWLQFGGQTPDSQEVWASNFSFCKYLAQGTFFHGKGSNTGWRRRTLRWRRRCSRRLCRATHKRLESGRSLVYFTWPLYQCVTWGQFWRTLERQLGALCRAVAVQLAEEGKVDKNVDGKVDGKVLWCIYYRREGKGEA